MWNDGSRSVTMAPEVSLPQFQVLGHTQKYIEASLSSGNYSRLVMEIYFARSVGYYLLQIYIPSSLIVIISWFSFWIDGEAGTARISHGAISVLAMIILFSSTSSCIPKVSYLKFLGVYLTCCLVFVIASLLTSISAVNRSVTRQKQQNIEVANTTSRSDKFSRIFFPVTFVCFQLVYWITMCSNIT